MILIALILIGPFVLGAKLLGASWVLAGFVGLVAWPVLATFGILLVFLYETLFLERKRRAEVNRLRERQGMPPLKRRGRVF